MRFNKKLFVVRHGQTIWNTQHRYQGREDSPLTELGAKQAKQVAEKLKEKDIKKIFTSPLGRTVMTSQIIANVLNINDIKSLNEMRERDYGCYEGLTKEETRELYPELYEVNITHKWDDAPYEAETLSQLEKRVIEGLEQIHQSLNDQNSLLVCHSGIMRILNKYFNQIKIDDKQYFDYYPDNCEIVNY